MRHLLRWGVLVALITLAVSACGGGGGGEQQQQPKARPLPESAQDLRPGEYRTEVFKPALSFTVGKGWALECPEGPDYVCLLPPGELTLFKFLNITEVYKPSELIDMSGETTPPPADLVGWFEQHPYLQTDKPQPVTVGGIKAKQIDVVVGDLPKDYPEGLCGGIDCVQLSQFNFGDWAVEEGNKDRVTVLEDVKGQTVIIDFGSPAAEFDEYWPEAEKVVESVQWKGT
ncbi:MAG TPA: hypothetical protein VK902_20495 [Rubrobacter sp.]|nr:hypothetical protein [Rubrobacter sp.]